MDGDSRVLGACPMDCPDTCSWIVTVHREPLPMLERLHDEVDVVRAK